MTAGWWDDEVHPPRQPDPGSRAGTDEAGRLAEALLAHRRVSAVGEAHPIECACGWTGSWLSRHQAAALLPVVRELGDLRAAEELEATADRIEAKSSHSHDEDDEAWEEDARDLRARVGALRGEAGR